MIDITKMKAELRRDERLCLKPYKDSVGKTSIGVGRNLDDVGITEQEAEFLLTNDIANNIHDLDMALPWWKKLSEVRQRALLNMCFNMGIHRLLTFKKMLEALRAEDYISASSEAVDSKWARQVGSRAQRIAVQFVTG